MTATLDDVTKKIKAEPTGEQLAAEELGPAGPGARHVPDRADGLLKQLTKTVLETVKPVAAIASPVPSPTCAPRRDISPSTCARSRRNIPSITERWKLRMPSVRMRAPLKAGRWLSTIRTVLVVASTNRGGSSNRQPSSTRAWLTTAPIRSS